MRSLSSRTMTRSVLASVALVLGVTSSTLAAGPTREVVLLEDSAVFDEVCPGFPVRIDFTGKETYIVFGEGARRVGEIDTYLYVTTYTNTQNGTSLSIRDSGPDRWYVDDGRLYIAVTGRPTTSTGVIGVVIIDFETFDIVFQAGNEDYVPTYFSTLCDRLE